MAKPAARIDDYHICPAYSGDNPHIGGCVDSGSGDVLFNRKPSARVGDTATCDGVGQKDTISQGSRSVFINGKQAARIGDATIHGGAIVGGSENISIG